MIRYDVTVRAIATALTLAGALALGPVAARAQGGFSMPPDMAAKIKALQKWGEAHKKVSDLQTMLYQVGELDKSQDTKLDKKQAAKLLVIIHTWASKPELNEDQALTVQKQIGNVLNLKQIQKMTTIQPPWKRMQAGGGGGGGARPGGAGFKIPDPPKGSYNPLNPDTLPFVQFRPQAKHAMQEWVTDLQQRAKG